MKLSFKSFVLFFSVAFIAISCGGSDNPSPTVNKVCQLTKVSEISQTSNVVTTYKYSGDGKVIEMNAKRISPTPSEVMTTFSYDATGKLSKRTIKYIGTAAMDIEELMIYKINGQLEKIQFKVVGNNNVLATTTFEYNSTNQISKIVAINQVSTYDYSNGNISSFSITTGRNTQLIGLLNYDNKRNPLNGLTSAFPDRPEYTSLNNYRASSLTQNGFLTPNQPLFNYTYNSENFPTKVDYSNSNQTATIVYEYANCK
jgi:hypothetical protein